MWAMETGYGRYGFSTGDGISRLVRVHICSVFHRLGSLKEKVRRIAPTAAVANRLAAFTHFYC